MSDATDPTETRRGLPRWVKALILTVLIAVGIVVLFTWVFPWVESNLQNPTMGALAPAAPDLVW